MAVIVVIGLTAWVFSYFYIGYFNFKIPFDLKSLIFSITGGLAFFLLGMDFLNSGLRNLAGNGLKSLLHSLTRRPFYGILFGISATAILQSSSATTVMVVGLINSGLLSLYSAIGVIMGSNIGTTITGQIIAFNLEKFALPILSVGIFLHLFGGRERTKNIGATLTGFGMLFFGLLLMKSEMSTIGESETVRMLLAGIADHPLLGLLASVIFTLLVQASAAVLGIIIALSTTGALSLDSALPLILGLNIGTTITANLAAIRASENAKRAARIHFLFNVIGSIIFLILLKPFSLLVEFVTDGFSPARAIANAHTLFNVISTIIFFPFIGLLVRFSFWLIPKTDSESELAFLDITTLADPDVALDQVKLACLEMQKVAIQGLCLMSRLAIDYDEDKGHAILQCESKLDDFQEKTIKFLEELGKSKLTSAQTAKITGFIHIINHYEQIGDLLEIINATPAKMAARELIFGFSQRRALRQAFSILNKLLQTVKYALVKENNSAKQKVWEHYKKWKAKKEEILFKNRQLALRRGLNVDKINFFVDIVLPLDEIAKKCSNIAWETDGDKQMEAYESNAV